MIKFLMAILSGVALNLGCAELYANAGHWSRRIVQWAARQMPINLRDRFEEEWIGVLEETSGNLSKLYFAMGCCYTALRTPSDLTIKPDAEEYVSIRSIYDSFPDRYSRGLLTGKSKIQAQLWIALLDSSVPIDEVASMTDREIDSFLTEGLGFQVDDFMEAATTLDTDVDYKDEAEIAIAELIKAMDEHSETKSEAETATQQIKRANGDMVARTEICKFAYTAGWMSGNLKISVQMYCANAFLSKSGKWIIPKKQKPDNDG